MKTLGCRPLLIAVILTFGSVAILQASGPAGCYAIVEKVVIEPNDKAPERVQVWGVFALSDAKSGIGYLAPQRGYLYFKLPADDQTQILRGARANSKAIALTEWNDLKTIAGSGQAVAFAERTTGVVQTDPAYYWTARIRTAKEAPVSPEVYPIYNGITVIGPAGLSDLFMTGIVAQLREALKAR